MENKYITNSRALFLVLCFLYDVSAAEAPELPDEMLAAEQATLELHYRASWSNLPHAYVRARLERGVDPNTVIYEDGGTLLAHAACHADVLMVEMLLEYGADVDFVDSGGNTALLYVLLPRMFDRPKSDEICGITDVLCKHGACVDICNDFGATPLSLSVDYPEVLSHLIKKNANLDMQGTLGRTALSDAAAGHQLASAKLLLDAGANPLLKDTNENTAWHHAVEIMREKPWMFDDSEKKKNALAVIDLLDQASKSWFKRQEHEAAGVLQKVNELQIAQKK